MRKDVAGLLACVSLRIAGLTRGDGCSGSSGVVRVNLRATFEQSLAPPVHAAVADLD